jgi:hypothetical protein
MILRRLAEALRRQDWSTVFLEIVIVVLGVFLGLQANNWNEAQSDRRLERQYLERLYQDAVLSIEDNLAGQAWDDERARTQRVVLDVLASGELAEAARTDFDAGLIYFGYHNTLSMRWATVEELRSTGKMGVISDVALRDLLAQAEASFHYRAAQTQTLTERIRRYREAVDRRFAPINYDHKLNGPVTLAYDFEQLSTDPEFYNTLAQIEFFASLARRNMGHHLARLEALRDALGKALGKEIQRTPATP